MKKVYLGHEIVLDYFKDDKDFVGGIYVDIPSEKFTIDIEEITEEVEEIYINSYSFYMAHFWLNYKYLKHLKIKLIDFIDKEYYVYDYYLDKDLNYSIFSNIKHINIDKISLIGSSTQTKRIYNFLKSFYEVEIVDKVEKNNVNINCTNNKFNNIIEKFIFNDQIIDLTKVLSEELNIKQKVIIDYLIANYDVVKYNPYAALAYFYEYHLPRKNKKSIAFYAPSCAYRNNLVTEYVLDHLANRYNVFLMYNVKCNDKFEQKENSFFIPNSLIAYFENINIIVHPQLDILLPNKPKNFYLLHDIYDSPSGKAEKQRKDKNGNVKASKFLEKVDYIFLPIKILYENKNLSIYKTKICLIPGGYFKLDSNIEKFKNLSKTLEIDSIIYAPTVINEHFFKYHPLPKYGEKIIETMLKFDFNVIFRPHPHSVDSEYTKKIVEKYKNNKKFIFDNNPSEYMQSYTRSKLMITDFSGTAYTYAFTTNRPVIFFSPNDEELVKNLGNGIKYFEDRKEIGKVATNLEELFYLIEDVLNNYNKITKHIENFRDAMVFNVNKSEDYFIKCVDTIMQNKTLEEWIWSKGK